MNDASLYSNLPVYRDCYAVALEFAKARQELPRDTRYTIAQDLHKAIVAMMVTIYRANATRADKARLIGEMRRTAVEAKIYFRLLSDLRQLGTKRAAFFMEKMESISKQLAAWHKRAMRESGIFKGAEPPPPAGGRPECGGPRPVAASQKANPMSGAAARAGDPAAKGGLAENTEATP